MTSNTDISILITDIFSHLTYNEIKELSLLHLFQRIITIRNYFYKKFNESTKISINDWKKTYGGQTTTEEREVLFEAYELIQQLRMRLTGDELNYRLYITEEIDGISQIKMVEVPPARLREFLPDNLGMREIDISASKIKAQATTSFQENSILAQWNDIIHKFDHPSRGKYRKSIYIQTRDTVSQYGLITRKTSKRWAVFNQGHLIEALDKANTTQTPIRDKEDLIRIFFSYLQLDSNPGFKGGDNAMTQIKANSARLMRYTTILNALNTITDFYTMLQSSTGDRTRVVETIKKLYFESNADAAINDSQMKMINTFIDKVEKIF